MSDLAHLVWSVPGMMQGSQQRLVLIAFLSFLTSALMGWTLTMHSDSLVSKESQRSNTVGAMVAVMVGACCGRQLDSWLELWLESQLSTVCQSLWMLDGWCPGGAVGSFFGALVGILVFVHVDRAFAQHQLKLLSWTGTIQ